MVMQSLQEKADDKIRRLIEFFLSAQASGGEWRFCFESGPTTDAYMVILLRLLESEDEDLIRRLAWRVAAKQETGGAWKLFSDQPDGDLSATVEAYLALLFSGYRRKEDPEMRKAREFILSQGGASKVGSLTKVLLALTGYYSWDNFPPIPPEIILLPTWSPVNFYDFVGYTRVHAAPIIICAGKKFSLSRTDGPDLSDLFLPTGESIRYQAPHALRHLVSQLRATIPLSPKEIHTMALKKLERFMLARIEEDGTLYSYFTTTFLMIFALLAVGYPKGHPVIVKALDGLEKLVCRTGGFYHLQESTSTVWDTALITHALQEAGVPLTQPSVQQAASYLLTRQQTKYGDWQVHNSDGRPGGWGFSDINTINPDVDDTSYSLRALYDPANAQMDTYRFPWQAGLDWLLTMQNNDGGWPAFEKNTDKQWLNYLPIPDAKPIWADPSSADLTGRTLEFLGRFAGLARSDEKIERAVNWLLKNQRPDGSWYGRWGIAYIYGTWAVVTGLAAVGVEPSHPMVDKAVQWLLSIQNTDGGWGESCQSDKEEHYIPLGWSTPSQTAWALDALIAVGLKGTSAVERGVACLLDLVEQGGMVPEYPTGAGLPGGFYIHYHSYRYVWPLLALSHYRGQLKYK